LQAFSQPVPNVVPTDLTCYNQNDGTVTANPTGGNPPYTYHWNTGVLSQQITGLVPALYFVTITDASGCNVTGFGVVNQPAELIATISSTNESSPGAGDGTATVVPTGGTPPYTYAWSSGGTLDTETGLAAGTYTVTVTDVNGCSLISTVTVDVSVGTAAAMLGPEIGLWPNPNNGSFYIAIHLPSHQDLTLRLYNALGQVVEQRLLTDIMQSTLFFDGVNLSDGVYQLQISSSEFRVTKKVVVYRD
jgi:hypothetical protein